MSLIAKTPEPPYQVIIFISHCGDDDKAYAEMGAGL